MVNSKVPNDLQTNLNNQLSQVESPKCINQPKQAQVIKTNQCVSKSIARDQFQIFSGQSIQIKDVPEQQNEQFNEAQVLAVSNSKKFINYQQIASDLSSRTKNQHHRRRFLKSELPQLHIVNRDSLNEINLTNDSLIRQGLADLQQSNVNKSYTNQNTNLQKSMKNLHKNITNKNRRIKYKRQSLLDKHKIQQVTQHLNTIIKHNQEVQKQNVKDQDMQFNKELSNGCFLKRTTSLYQDRSYNNRHDYRPSNFQTNIHIFASQQEMVADYFDNVQPNLTKQKYETFHSISCNPEQKTPHLLIDTTNTSNDNHEIDKLTQQTNILVTKQTQQSLMNFQDKNQIDLVDKVDQLTNTVRKQVSQVGLDIKSLQSNTKCLDKNIKLLDQQVLVDQQSLVTFKIDQDINHCHMKYTKQSENDKKQLQPNEVQFDQTNKNELTSNKKPKTLVSSNTIQKVLISPIRDVKINLTETKRSKKSTIIQVNKSQNDLCNSQTVQRDQSRPKMNHLKIKTGKQKTYILRDFINGIKEPMTGIPNSRSPLNNESKTEFTSNWPESKYNTESKIREPEKPNIEDFEVGQIIGMGNFSKVYKALNTKTNTWVALKVMKKESVAAMKHVDHIINERNVLKYLADLQIKINNNLEDVDYSGNSFSYNCPFIVKFISSFQDDDNLFLEMEYVHGSSMITQIRQTNLQLRNHFKFYTMELLYVLGYLKDQSIIYRDLKPENVLISIQDRGHIKLVDFGFSKMLKNTDGKTDTNCGTPAYIAPEILKNIPYSYEVDVWSWGILLVEIVSGQTPFYAEDTKGIYEKIIKCQPNYSHLINYQLRDLLNKIFVLDQENRLSISEIKKHSVFQEINWNQKMSDIFYQTKAPFLPKEDTSSQLAGFNQKQNKNSLKGLFQDNKNFKLNYQRVVEDTNQKLENQQMVFDEDHFKQFLEQDQHNDYQYMQSCQFASSTKKNPVPKRKRQNILGDFKFKKINEVF